MNLKKLADQAISWGFYTLFFLTPFLFNPSRSLPSFELFEWNKMAFVYLTTIWIGIFWLVKMIIQKRVLLHRTPFDIPLLLFFFSQCLATLFSLDRHVSIFGYYSRFHGGLLSTFTYIFLFYAYVSNSNTIRLSKLIFLGLSSGLMVALFGIMEKFGIDAHMWVQDVESRVFSTLGQPNWLAALIAVLLPLTQVWFVAPPNEDEVLQPTKKTYLFSGVVAIPYAFLLYSILSARPEHINQFIVLFFALSIPVVSLGLSYALLYLKRWELAAVILYSCLLFTKSRSGFLAFWAANALFWLALLWRKPQRRKILTLLLLVNIAYVLLNFVIRTPLPLYNKFATLDLFSKTPVVEKTKPDLSGSSVIDVGITDSADIRRIVWKGAVDIVKQYPVFGTGPETFAYAYYRYRPAEHNLTSEWDFLYNRAHNEFLNVAATSGLFGLGTYLLLIGTVFFWGARRFISHKSHDTLVTGLLAAYVTIQVTNFFGFSVVIIGLYFFLIPAFMYTVGISHLEPEDETTPQLLTRQQMLLILCTGLGIFLTWKVASWWIADSAYAKANNFKRTEDYTDAYQSIVKATALRSDEPVYHDERATIAAAVAAIALEQKEATLAAQLAKEAVEESSKALEISPQNVNFWKSRTRILYQFSSFDPAFTQNALESILVAQQLAPTDAKIAYNVAVLYGETGKIKETIETLNQTIALKPDYRDAYIALAIYYQKDKQLEKARETLELLLKRVNPNDTEAKQRLEELK